MIKMIKPIVNISKIIDAYDTVITGFNGVITDGKSVKSEAVEALINMKKSGKTIVMVTNSPLRVEKIARYLKDNKVPLAIFESIVSAGEIMHYNLKNRLGLFAAIGINYFVLGNQQELGVFSGLGYQRVDTITKADFIYMSGVACEDDTLDKYLPLLEHAASLGIPLVCTGNDTSSYINGSICLSVGTIAEQYAVLGSKIITVGKPDVKILAYGLDGVDNLKKDRTLLIGDNIATDIRGANFLDIASVLISKGVHVNYLGEGYIPDVAKTRELATTFDTYPNFIISNLRW